MDIKLIAHTPNALQVAFAAIRTCYSSLFFDEILGTEYEKYKANNNDDIRLVKQIASHGHTSTLEHITFTFSIAGISRACLGQLTRHRIASYSVRSQRYTKSTATVDCVIAGDPIYTYLLDQIQKGYNELIAKGYKAEDARMILPQSGSTNLVMTINLRSFLNMYSVRHLGTHAQAEIGEVVEAMKNAILAAEPWVEVLFNE